MQALLEGLLPRLFPHLAFRCVVHEGKDELDQNITQILRDWRVPGDRFIVVRDNDEGDCYALKQRLRQLCLDGRRSDTLIRIVCQELEAWYLGEPDAMADAFGDERLRRIRNSPRYRDPDTRSKPSNDVKKLVSGFQKVEGARKMAARLTQERNRSPSFAVFLDGIARMSPPPQAG